MTYQLHDLQGSIVATAPASGTSAASTEYDPFGIVTTAATHVIDWTQGLPANGWLGAHQRPTDFGQDTTDAAGPIEMGARVYLPKVGRFLQVDPVDGGSANAYDYANQDPVNGMDLTGQIHISFRGIAEVVGGAASITVGVFVGASCTIATDAIGAIHCWTAAGAPIGAGGILFSVGIDDIFANHPRATTVTGTIRVRHAKNQCSLSDYKKRVLRHHKRRRRR